MNLVEHKDRKQTCASSVPIGQARIGAGCCLSWCLSLGGYHSKGKSTSVNLVEQLNRKRYMRARDGELVDVAKSRPLSRTF